MAHDATDLEDQLGTLEDGTWPYENRISLYAMYIITHVSEYAWRHGGSR